MTIQDASAHMLSKVSSGRWLCTVTVTAAYVYAVVTGLIDAQTITEVTKLVLMFYFLKTATENQ
jgi:hypothetical protein